jgi:hypothetical protein
MLYAAPLDSPQNSDLLSSAFANNVMIAEIRDVGG